MNREVSLQINSLGDEESLASYRSKLTSYFEARKEQLSELSQKRLIYNPLRILDSKEEEDQAIVAEAPIILDHLTSEASDRFTNLCDLLHNLNINFVINPRLVRGLDYYTGLVFELLDKKSGRALAAGGRYDSLVEELGGPSLPSIGFAAGLDRLYDLLVEKDLLLLPEKFPLHLVPIGERAEDYAMNLAFELRSKGMRVALEPDLNSKKRLKVAHKNQAKIAIIFGDEELDKGEVILRLMDKANEITIALEELDDYLNKYGKNSILV